MNPVLKMIELQIKTHSEVIELKPKDFRGFINDRDFKGIETQVLQYIQSRQKDIRLSSGFTKNSECEFCRKDEPTYECYALDVLSDDEDYDSDYRQDWDDAVGSRATVTQEALRIYVCCECHAWQIDHDC